MSVQEPRTYASTASFQPELSLDECLLIHYGSGADILPYPFGPHDSVGYLVRCVRAALAACEEPPERALDLGCAVGAASFELARDCPAVVGVDLSSVFIEAAQRLRREGALPYRRIDEGDRSTPLVARIPDGVDPDRVEFRLGDACNLSAELGTFDLVLAANLLDRLADPARCLRDLRRLVRPGGVLFLSSSYTWREELTPRDRWLGGTPDQASFAALAAELQPDFSLLRRLDLPFLIREHARKYQWGVADASIWRRD